MTGKKSISIKHFLRISLAVMLLFCLLFQHYIICSFIPFPGINLKALFKLFLKV